MGLNYEAAGVNIEAGYEQVKLIKESIKRTTTENVLTDVGGFSGLVRLGAPEMEDPILVSGTDGVGTKLILAQELGIHNTVGIDLVAMSVNDILCQGAKPLFFLDYIATGKLVPEKMAEIVAGVAEGCVQSHAALVGGETAEMPGLYSEDEYDLAGFAVGVVDRKDVITGHDIAEGDVAIGISSSGVHSNGFSLVRLILEKNNIAFTDTLEGYDKPIGEVLLTPTKIYVDQVKALISKVKVKGISHITGGGLYENVPRILPEGVGIEIDTKVIPKPQVFDTLQELGNVSDKDMYNTFNMGVGMIFFVSAEDVDISLEALKNSGEEAFVLGEVTSEFEGVDLQW